MILKPGAGFNVRKSAKRDRVWYARAQRLNDQTFLLTGGPTENVGDFIDKPAITRRDVVIRLGAQPDLETELVAAWRASVHRWEVVTEPMFAQYQLDYSGYNFDFAEVESSRPYLYLPRLRGRGYIGLIWQDDAGAPVGFRVENGNIAYNADMSSLSGAQARAVFGQILLHPKVLEEFLIAQEGDNYTLTAREVGEREPLLPATSGVHPISLATGTGTPGLGRISWFATLQILDSISMTDYSLVLVRPDGRTLRFRLSTSFISDTPTEFFLQVGAYDDEESGEEARAARDWATVVGKELCIVARSSGDTAYILDKSGEGFREWFWVQNWDGVRVAGDGPGVLTVVWGGAEGAEYAV